MLRQSVTRKSPKYEYSPNFFEWLLKFSYRKMSAMNLLLLCIVYGVFSVVLVASQNYNVTVLSRPSTTVISAVDKTASFSLVFNPSWIEPTASTGQKSGLLMRTQNCTMVPGAACRFCGGSAADASVLTFGNQNADGSFDFVDASTVVFGPSGPTDSWGTEDPRVKYNSAGGLYYMFYTAYNGIDIYLSLATSPNPTVSTQWTRLGPVFPDKQGSKSGALLLRDSGPDFLFWGDKAIRVCNSTNPTKWPADGGVVFLETRADYFDSQLVESGPPPLTLLNGDYIFFYNSAMLGWPSTPGSAYHPGWVILDRDDPTVIKQRSNVPLLTPEFAWELGDLPYTCNAPNVVFLEAAHRISETEDLFQVYFGGADAVVGTAQVRVSGGESSPADSSSSDSKGWYSLSTAGQIGILSMIVVVAVAAVAAVVVWYSKTYSSRDTALANQV